DWRTFRVDRIGRLSTGARFKPRPFPDDVAAYVSRAISVAAYAVRAQVRVAESAEALAARIPPWIGVIEAQGACHCLLAIGGPSRAAVADHRVFIDAEFEVIDPPELTPHIQALAERLARSARPA